MNDPKFKRVIGEGRPDGHVEILMNDFIGPSTLIPMIWQIIMGSTMSKMVGCFLDEGYSEGYAYVVKDDDQFFIIVWKNDPRPQLKIMLEAKIR